MVPQAGLEPAKTWLLRPVAVPICISHRGIWWLWLVSIQPPRLMRAVRIHLRHTTEIWGV